MIYTLKNYYLISYSTLLEIQKRQNSRKGGE